MRIRSNSIALGLSALAVVIAASGTAYAITATVVNIADPTTPTHIAKVDSAGRLQDVVTGTVGARPTPVANPFTVSLYMTQNNAYGAIRSQSTDVVTGITVSNTIQNSGTPHTQWAVMVARGVDTGSGCAAITTYNYRLIVPAGTSQTVTFPTPYTIKPTTSGSYGCFMVVVYTDDGGTPASYWLPYVTLSGYTTSGAVPIYFAHPSATPPHATAQNPHPAGAAN